MTRRHFARLLVLAGLVTCNPGVAQHPTTLALDGIWRFRLDPQDVGVAEKWFAHDLEDSVQLPGTTDENHKGIEIGERREDRLSRVLYWKGPAWYQREVTIPATWEGRRIELFFERTKNSRVWVDEAGWRRVLSIVRSWGLNHVRFHSWCPPEAAFAAADELGVYLQAELPNKRSAFRAPESEDAAEHNIDRLDMATTGAAGHPL